VDLTSRNYSKQSYPYVNSKIRLIYLLL